MTSYFFICMNAGQILFITTEEQTEERDQKQLVQVDHNDNPDAACNQPAQLVTAIAANAPAKHIGELPVPQRDCTACAQNHETDNK